MRNIRFCTLHPDIILPNIENIYYIHYIGKGIDVGKSRFQHTKTLKMNIRKYTSKRIELTIPLIFGLGTIVRLQVCSYHPNKMVHSRFHTSYHENKFANTETLFNIIWWGKLNNGRKYDFRSSTYRKWKWCNTQNKYTSLTIPSEFCLGTCVRCTIDQITMAKCST